VWELSALIPSSVAPSPRLVGDSVAVALSGRELHAYLAQEKTHFSVWMPRKIKSTGLVKNVDFITLLESTRAVGGGQGVLNKNVQNPNTVVSTVSDLGGRPEKGYYLTLPAALNVTAGSKSRHGVALRRHFVTQMVDEARRGAPDAPLLAAQVQTLQVEMQAKDERLRVLDTLTEVAEWFNLIKIYGTFGYLCLNCADPLRPSQADPARQNGGEAPPGVK